MTDTNIAQPLDKKNILMVDDRRDSVQYYLDSLIAGGAEVTLVDNLQDALFRINENNPPLDLILIDLYIPNTFVPPELRDDLVKLGDSQGQALGQYLIKNHINILYRYFSAVPQFFKKNENESIGMVWKKNNYSPPRKLVEAVAELLLQSRQASPIN